MAKITTKTTQPGIKVTSSKQRRVDPHKVAKALGANQYRVIYIADDGRLELATMTKAELLDWVKDNDDWFEGQYIVLSGGSVVKHPWAPFDPDEL